MHAWRCEAEARAPETASVAAPSLDQEPVPRYRREMGFARRAADRIVFIVHRAIVEERPKSEFVSAPRTKRAQEFLSNIKAH
jgi:hypothetical protein